MQEHDELDLLIKKGLAALADDAPVPDAKQALARFHAMRRRRDQQQRRTIMMRFGVAAVVVLIMITALSAPGYARFSWRTVLRDIGGSLGIVKTSDPSTPPGTTPPTVNGLPYTPQYPTWVPEGFALVDSQVTATEAGVGDLVLQYASSDGQQPFSIRQINVSTGFTSFDNIKGDAKLVKVGGYEGAISAFPGDVLILTLQKENIRFTIKGQLSEVVILRIAGSLK